MKVDEVINEVLTDAIFLEGFDPFDEEKRKDLVIAIVEALRKEFHMVPYAGQVSFE
tara:strand:+ start:38 stop:205 length:168 start_codon:yes stop_codon:yes gene_type:complete